jgi:outer membrane protein TolC
MRTFFIVLAAFFAVSFAAPSKTAEEYVRLALKANPDIRSVQYAYKAALEEAPINSTLPDPMIMTEGRGIPADPGNFGETREWMFMLEQRIPFPGKLSHMQRKSEINTQEMEFKSDDVRNQIIKWVEQTVYRIAYLDKALEIYQQQIDWMQRFEESVKSRYTVGSATRQEWLKAGIELQHFLAERIELEERRTNQVRLLNRLLDRRLDHPVAVESLPSDLPPIPEQELDSLLTHNNPALLAAQQRQRYAGVDVGLAKLSHYPDIALMGGFMVMNNMDDRLMGRISLTLPFLPWSGKDSGARIESAKIMKSKSILDYHYLREKLLQQLFNVSSSLRSIQKQKALYDEEILQSYQQLIELSLADYKTGGESYIAVIDNIRNLFKTEITYWSLIQKYMHNRAELEYTLGSGIKGAP